MKIRRYFTKKEVHPFDEIDWEIRSSTITNADGSIVFSREGIEVPSPWSQLATDIAASKYFRGETSVKQLITRVTSAIRSYATTTGEYFSNESDATAFEAELTHLLVNQKLAFNSPVWFNCGLFESPQCSACFIQSLSDDLMSIFDLAKNEARIFKFGSGTGTNFSKIRGPTEKLSGGGNASGVMGFLKILDCAAGAIKSGGTTRRAAKMVILDADHPEIEDFIAWKQREELKAAHLIKAGYSEGLDGEAYRSVSGQNSNNSVRLTDKFLKAVESNGQWTLFERTTKKPLKTLMAKELFRKIAEAAWSCADPGVQFDDTINEWHTCSQTDRIYASNPCSEYMFLDDSACNLASINLLKFLKDDGTFDIEGFKHTCKISILAQEILVGYSSYPTPQIAKNSVEFRPLGLGFANLGALLMCMGYPYDSDQARAWASTLTAILTGEAYVTSTKMASKHGPFAGFQKNKESMLQIMEKHRAALQKIDSTLIPQDLAQQATEIWDDVISLGKKNGFRNAQVSAIAPTGTIGLLMDCDTTGIEPEFSPVKVKKLSGGGSVRIVNNSLSRSLRKLGYSVEQMAAISQHVEKHSTMEGAPHLKAEHLAIFDCAVTSDRGSRTISSSGHLRMMAAVQPFLSGAISKTINLPKSTSIDDIEKIYFDAWKLGLKSIAIYRDHSKASQPLNVSTNGSNTQSSSSQVDMIVQENLFPQCSLCGHKTIHDGTCIKCLNCGHAMGCSS